MQAVLHWSRMSPRNRVLGLLVFIVSLGATHAQATLDAYALYKNVNRICIHVQMTLDQDIEPPITEIALEVSALAAARRALSAGGFGHVDVDSQRTCLRLYEDDTLAVTTHVAIRGPRAYDTDRSRYMIAFGTHVGRRMEAAGALSSHAMRPTAIAFSLRETGLVGRVDQVFKEIFDGVVFAMASKPPVFPPLILPPPAPRN